MQLCINNAVFVDWKYCFLGHKTKAQHNEPETFDFDIYAILNIMSLIPSSYVL
jgi:hypothetical protein